ncbi:MAG: methionine synthase, partial [Rhodobacterales bacterium]|nr:methionine synthase [Rhodobacterales bacterium]
ASRGVGVCSALMSDERRDAFVAETAAGYEKLRAARAGKGPGDLTPLDQARAARAPIDWAAYAPTAPAQPGLTVFDDVPLGDLVDRIDWTPFFRTWDLHGTYPRILDDAKVGEAARSLFIDARAMLTRIVDEKWLTARGVVGLWPANAVGDDVRLFTDDTRSAVLDTLPFLRQQVKKSEGRVAGCLADFVAPLDSGVADWMGAFAVTAGIGLDAVVAEFEAAHDDYQAIMAKALADRLAEAFAEWLHEKVRTQVWGYAAGEALDNEALIREAYRGIRPAPGYPACPDHTEKGRLFALLDAPANTGLELTDSFAMTPTAAVCGTYFAHPEAAYFGVGRIGPDQVADYAARKGWTTAEAERWLAPVLGYDPESRAA